MEIINYILSLTFVLHLSVTFVILWVATSLGKLLIQYSSEYQPITSMFGAENSTGFNAIYRIVFAPISIVFIAIALYLFQLDDFVNNLWLVAVYFFVTQFLLIVVLGRWRLVNKLKFFLFHSVSIGLSIYIYSTLIAGGLAHLLPDEANLRTDLWLLVALFLYGIFRSIPENRSKFQKRRESYVQNKAEYLRKKYRFKLDEYGQEFQDILVSIMIYENYNRPKVIRILELLIPTAKTKYIMQVYGAKNDLDSISSTADNLKYIYEEHTKKSFANTWDEEISIRSLFNAHNPSDYRYGARVYDVFKEIKR